MTVLKWIYNRIGQMLCFGFGAVAIGGSDGNATSPEAAAIAGAGLLLAGVGLKAIFHWRRMSDPDLV